MKVASGAESRQKGMSNASWDTHAGAGRNHSLDRQHHKHKWQAPSLDGYWDGGLRYGSRHVCWIHLLRKDPGCPCHSREHRRQDPTWCERCWTLNTMQIRLASAVVREMPILLGGGHEETGLR